MIKATHELHDRRKGLNTGVGISLAALVVIVMGLTMVKVSNGTFIEKPDHVTSPGMLGQSGEASQ